jgi:hypothetical protein
MAINQNVNLPTWVHTLPVFTFSGSGPAVSRS